MSVPEITVVVCTRNRAELLRAVLRDLYAQDLAHDRYEVVVVNNGSTDHTNVVIDEFGSDDRFRRVEEPVAGLSHARNRGWREARGQYVGYTDDDCRIPRQWLSVAARVIAEHRPNVFGGPIEPFFSSPPPAWFDESYVTRTWGSSSRCLRSEENLSGGNIFFLRQLLSEIGGFPGHLGMSGDRVAYGEETAVQRQLRECSPEGVAFYHPDLRVRHLERPEKLRWRWMVRGFLAKGRDVYLASGTPSGPLPTRAALTADFAKTTLALVGHATFRMVVRDRRRYPYYQNFIYERGSQYLKRLGRLGAQLGWF